MAAYSRAPDNLPPHVDATRSSIAYGDRAFPKIVNPFQANHTHTYTHIHTDTQTTQSHTHTHTQTQGEYRKKKPMRIRIV